MGEQFVEHRVVCYRHIMHQRCFMDESAILWRIQMMMILGYIPFTIDMKCNIDQSQFQIEILICLSNLLTSNQQNTCGRLTFKELLKLIGEDHCKCLELDVYLALCAFDYNSHFIFVFVSLLLTIVCSSSMICEGNKLRGFLNRSVEGGKPCMYKNLFIISFSCRHTFNSQT